MKTLILTFILMLATASGLRAQDPPKPSFPPYPQRTEATLYEQLGRCNADLGDLSKWTGDLKAQVTDKDKAIAAVMQQLSDLHKKQTELEERLKTYETGTPAAHAAPSK